MKICIFGESLDFDSKLFNILCSRVLKECFGINQIEIVKHEFDPGGHGQLEKQAPILIDLFFQSDPKLNIVFIFRDSDNLTYKKRRKKIMEILKGKVKDFPLDSIIVGVPKRNIEAWLISDTNNINKIAGTTLSNRFLKAENIVDPKEKFNKIWELTGKSEKKMSLRLK